MKKPGDKILKYPSDLTKFYGGEKNIVSFTTCDYSQARMGNKDGQEFVVVKPDMKSAVYVELSESFSIGDTHGWDAGTVLDANIIDSLKGAGGGLGQAGSRMGWGATMGIANFGLNKIGGQYLGNDALQNQVRVSRGSTEINPNTTMIYSSSGIRTLDFMFVMRPENEPEAIEISSIVDYFKYYSRGSVPKGVGGIRFPYLWYIRTSSKAINSILESGDGEESVFFACTSIVPTLHTDVLYHNEYPHRTDLSLSFSEMRVRYRTDE